jgi:hypothetical protein
MAPRTELGSGGKEGFRVPMNANDVAVKISLSRAKSRKIRRWADWECMISFCWTSKPGKISLKSISALKMFLVIKSAYQADRVNNIQEEAGDRPEINSSGRITH